MNTIKELIDGNNNYLENGYKQDKDNLTNLVINGQKPHTLLITCCDSRISPSKIFDCEDGILFVHRAIGNIVPREEDLDSSMQSTLEYAVGILEVNNIMVCGHSHCGAYASIGNTNLPKGLNKWLSYVKRDLDKLNIGYTKDNAQTLEQEGVKLQIKNLMSYSLVKNKVEKKELNLYGTYFDIQRGKVLYYNSEVNKFI